MATKTPKSQPHRHHHGKNGGQHEKMMNSQAGEFGYGDVAMGRFAHVFGSRRSTSAQKAARSMAISGNRGER